MSRPTKLTPELQAKFMEALKLGLPPEAVCGLVDISPDTYYRWMRDGAAKKRGIFYRFRKAVERSIPSGEASLALIVRTAAQTDPKLALDWLSRRWPERWARKMLKPDEPGQQSSITVVFNRPEIDPDEKGDDLVVVNDVGEKPGNGGSK